MRPSEPGEEVWLSHGCKQRRDLDTFGDLSAWNAVFLLRVYNRKPLTGQITQQVLISHSSEG